MDVRFALSRQIVRPYRNITFFLLRRGNLENYIFALEGFLGVTLISKVLFWYSDPKSVVIL